MSAGHVTHKIEFRAGPTQRRFIEDDHRAALFSSRAGEGKSAALCWKTFHFCRKYAAAKPGCIVARNTLVNLRATTLQEWFKWFELLGDWKASEMLWTWKPNLGLGGEVRFMGFEDEKSTQKALSMPIDMAALDEAAPATESGGINEMVFDMLLTRARNPKVDKPTIGIAVNNTDEDHWLYQRFVEPGDEEFKVFQTGASPENLENLRPGYYEDMERDLRHRPDLVRRYVKGQWGFQQIGVAVTPEWADDVHLAGHLEPEPGIPLLFSWDGGGNPTCMVSQVVGFNWNILLTMTDDRSGTYQLIEQMKPIIASRFDRYVFKHTGDPNLATKDQSDYRRSPVKMIKTELGGSWTPGPVDIEGRVEPARRVLTRQNGGIGMVQVDKRHAKATWYALRGGWHYPKSATGIVSDKPAKDKHSHPGDCFGYEAARSFPNAAFSKRKKNVKIRQASIRRNANVQSRFVVPPGNTATKGTR